MLHNEKNSNSVGTQQNQPEDSFDLNKTMQNLPNSDIANDPKKLKERITDLLKGDTEFSKMKQGDKILVVSAASGLFTAVLPLLAVGATLAIPGAIVGLALYFAVKVAVKTVQSGYKGLKWSAEKTVDGAKYTAGKVKDASTYAAGKVRDGAVHVKDKVKEGYEHSVDSLKKGASFVGEGVANKFHKASGETDYLDKVKRFTPDAIKKSDEIRNDMKAIFADKGNNSGLVKNVLSGISSEIDLKMAEKAKSGEIEHTSGWQVQKEFINSLNEKSLHNLLTQRSLPKGSYFIDSVFSEHYDEIKKVIKECRENHLYSSVSNMFDRAEKKANRPSVKSLTRSVSSSFSSLGRKGSEQSNSLSKSNSLNSVKTDSTVSSEAELLNPAEHKEVKAPSSLWDRVSSPFKSGKKSEKTSEVKYQVLSESDTLPRKIGNSTFYVDTPTPIENTNKTATIGGRPGVARRNSTSNLTRVGTPEVPTRSASLTNLNGQSSFSEDVLSDPKVNQYFGNSNKGTLTRSNSFDSARGSSGPSTPTSSLERLEQSFSKDEVGAAMEKNLKEFSLSAKTESTLHNSFSNRNGSDSGFNSPTSSPTHTMFTENGKAKTQADLRKTGHLDKLVGQPSTKVAVDTDVQQQAAQTAVKTN
ncbi:hypothetical protein [Wolbachia endosymbiont (group A) of Cydia amplana]|uniref:actin-bundling T4SS effector WalE1 family protein n=1 Tax=Wolbachia endosymbiont (group A) of Cydia amplana TaxID=3066169 RepID=UPI0033427180